MVPIQGSVHDIESAKAAIAVIAVVAAVFWKQVILLLLALMVIAVGVGAFVLMQGMHG